MLLVEMSSNTKLFPQTTSWMIIRAQFSNRSNQAFVFCSTKDAARDILGILKRKCPDRKKSILFSIFSGNKCSYVFVIYEISDEINWLEYLALNTSNEWGRFGLCISVRYLCRWYVIYSPCTSLLIWTIKVFKTCIILLLEIQ